MVPQAVDKIGPSPIWMNVGRTTLQGTLVFAVRIFNVLARWCCDVAIFIIL